MRPVHYEFERTHTHTHAHTNTHIRIHISVWLTQAQYLPLEDETVLLRDPSSLDKACGELIRFHLKSQRTDRQVDYEFTHF